MNSRIIFVFGFMIALVIILIILFFLFSKDRFSFTPGQPPTSGATTPQPQNYPPPYAREASDKLVDIVNSRPEMSQDDQAARSRLLDLLNYKSGSLYTTEEIKISYVKEPNIFQAEIITPEIEKAKERATLFFKEQGFSEDGICKLPLMFYLSLEFLQEFKNSGRTFVSIPDYCL